MDTEINGPHITVWYDESDNEMDGLGWCFTYNPGSVTYRFESFDSLLTHFKFDEAFNNKFLTNNKEN